MLKQFTILPAVLVLCVPWASAQDTTAAAKGWAKLFRGNSLEGWEVVPIGSGGGKWTLDQGVLHVSRKPPDRGAAWLVSRKDYEDFILRVKFRPNGTDYVTGLLIRDPGHAKIGRPAFNGYEVALQRSPTGENLDGSIYHVANAYNNPVDPDRWTEIEVRCIGDHLVVFLNGKKTSEAHTRRAYKGGIGFHLHGGEEAVNWEFKDAEIKELPPSPHPYQLMEERLSADPHPAVPLFATLENDFTGNSDSRWSLNNAILAGAGHSQDSVLLTNRSFANFLLDFEFKIVKGGNAGVLFRIPPDGRAEDGYQFYIADPIKDHPIGSLFHLARAFSVDANNQPIVKSEAWTRGRIFASADHVVTFINNEKGVDIHDNRGLRGQIGFRVGPHAKIEFRNVTVKPVHESPQPKSLGGKQRS